MAERAPKGRGGLREAPGTAWEAPGRKSRGSIAQARGSGLLAEAGIQRLDWADLRGTHEAARREPFPHGSSEDRLTLPTARQLASEANAFDAELMAKVRARDANALRALYDRHSSLVYGLGLKMLRDQAEAEDLAQDVFLHLWRRADLFDGERGAFLGWLVSLTRNRAIDRLRARRAGEKKADAFEVERQADVAPRALDPNETAYAGELRGAVAKVLGVLPEAQRTALELAYFGGLSHAEIAGQLDTPPGTVKARIRQGMLRMRDLLGDFAAAGPIADTEG